MSSRGGAKPIGGPSSELQNTLPVRRSTCRFISGALVGAGVVEGLMNVQLAPSSVDRSTPIGKPLGGTAGWNKTIRSLVIAMLTSDVRKPVCVMQGIGARPWLPAAMTAFA